MRGVSWSGAGRRHRSRMLLRLGYSRGPGTKCVCYAEYDAKQSNAHANRNCNSNTDRIRNDHSNSDTNDNANSNADDNAN